MGSLQLVAGPAYWASRAAMKRTAWACEAKAVDEGAVRAELRRRAPRGHRKRLAHELGMNERYLGQVMLGQRPISRRLADILGFRMVSPVPGRRFERVG